MQSSSENDSGDPLRIEKQDDGRFIFFSSAGQAVCRSSRSFSFNEKAEYTEVAAILLRNKTDQEEHYQAPCKMDRWAVVVPRIVYVAGGNREQKSEMSEAVSSR